MYDVSLLILHRYWKFKLLMPMFEVSRSAVVVLAAHAVADVMWSTPGKML
jgi:hypothetical protein